MTELDKALEIYGLDKAMFDQMKKSDLKVFIQLSCKDTNSNNNKHTYGQILLNAKTKLKRVRINEPEKHVQTRARSQSIEYCVPVSASIDVLFNSLVCPNTFI